MGGAAHHRTLRPLTGNGTKGQQRGYEFRPAGADLRIDCVVFARHAGVHALATTSVSIV